MIVQMSLSLSGCFSVGHLERYFVFVTNPTIQSQTLGFVNKRDDAFLARVFFRWLCVLIPTGRDGARAAGRTSLDLLERELGEKLEHGRFSRVCNVSILDKASYLTLAPSSHMVFQATTPLHNPLSA